MSIPFDDWVEEAYRRIVADAGINATKRTEAVAEILADLADAVEAGDVAIPLNPEPLVWAIVKGGDEERRRRQTHDVEYLVAVIGGQTILGADNPWLDSVCVVGGGVRKAWRHVDTDDFLAMAARKSEHARAAVVAADDFLQAVRTVTAHMRRAHGSSAVVGDLA